jgi:hypothetical protein
MFYARTATKPRFVCPLCLTKNDGQGNRNRFKRSQTKDSTLWNIQYRQVMCTACKGSFKAVEFPIKDEEVLPSLESFTKMFAELLVEDNIALETALEGEGTNYSKSAKVVYEDITLVEVRNNIRNIEKFLHDRKKLQEALVVKAKSKGAKGLVKAMKDFEQERMRVKDDGL